MPYNQKDCWTLNLIKPYRLVIGHAKQKNGLNVSAKARVDEVEVEIVDAERLEAGRWRK